jgi:electron transport complex protein RnfD
MVNGLLIALAPQVLLLGLIKNVSALLVIGAGIAASVTAEVISVILLRMDRRGVSVALAQGCMAGMLFPQDYPLFSAFIIILGVFLLFKYVPGSPTGSWVNAAAFAAAAAFFVGAEFFPPLFNPGDAASAPQGLLPDAALTSALNAAVFRHTGASVPQGYFSLLWDSGSAIPAFRFNALILGASLFLFSLNMLNRIIPLCFLSVYLALVWFFGGLLSGGPLGSGDVLFAAFTGGTLFTAFFLLDWFGTSPLSVWGKIAYGLGAGVAAFFLSGCGLSPCGAALTVLSANLLSTVIQFFETLRSRRVLVKKIIPKIKDVWRLPND